MRKPVKGWAPNPLSIDLFGAVRSRARSFFRQAPLKAAEQTNPAHAVVGLVPATRRWRPHQVGAARRASTSKGAIQIWLKPLYSMYAPSRNRMLANTRLSFFTGSACAALAPTGAISTLQTAITTSAGSHT